MAWQDDALTVLSAYSSIRLAVVFGSITRGRSRGDSDIDIGVLVDADSPDIAQALEVDLARAQRRPDDLFLLNTAPPLLRFEVARDGEVLSAREAPRSAAAAEQYSAEPGRPSAAARAP